MLRFLKWMCVGVLSTHILVVVANEMPSQSDIDSAKKAIEEAIDSAKTLEKNQTFLGEIATEQEKIRNVPSDGHGNFYDLSKITPQSSPHDMKNVFDQANNLDNPGAEVWTDAPLVMISLSMPEHAIDLLMKEATRIGANIVLRGAKDGDLNATIQYVQKLAKIDDPDSPNDAAFVQIDPTLFKRFEVTSAPTFVLPLEPIKTCSEMGCEVPQHVKAHGTATLRYFLEKVSRLAENDLESEAADRWLAKYEGN